ncbi:hypothetical protein FRC03_006419, partial [Tulasnella sp. 419]
TSANGKISYGLEVALLISPDVTNAGHAAGFHELEVIGAEPEVLYNSPSPRTVVAGTRVWSGQPGVECDE